MSKQVWVCLSVKQLENMLAVANELSKTHGVCNSNLDCGIYTLSVERDNQASFESVRAAASEKNYLPDNLLHPALGESPLIRYHGEYVTPPRSLRRKK